MPMLITYTAVNTWTDSSKPENKRRLFRNLHWQLIKELERAIKCGSWTIIPADVLKEAWGHAAKPAEHWVDLDADVLAPRIRELLKLLIAKRREMKLL
jgi:hypothetical protein